MQIEWTECSKPLERTVTLTMSLQDLLFITTVLGSIEPSKVTATIRMFSNCEVYLEDVWNDLDGFFVKTLGKASYEFRKEVKECL